MNAKLPDIKVKIVNCLLSLVITPILSSVNIWSAFYVTYLLINLLINYDANFVTLGDRNSKQKGGAFQLLGIGTLNKREELFNYCIHKKRAP